MKHQYLFRFLPLNSSMAEFVDRRRLSKMLQVYRRNKNQYRVLRIDGGYIITCGLAKAIISKI